MRLVLNVEYAPRRIKDLVRFSFLFDRVYCDLLARPSLSLFDCDYISLSYSIIALQLIEIMPFSLTPFADDKNTSLLVSLASGDVPWSLSSLRIPAGRTGREAVPALRWVQSQSFCGGLGHQSGVHRHFCAGPAGFVHRGLVHSSDLLTAPTLADLRQFLATGRKCDRDAKGTTTHERPEFGRGVRFGRMAGRLSPIYPDTPRTE
jgi:hypothetical protein